MQDTRLRLPHLIGDGMVLQRNTQVKLWGWAPAGERISVHFQERISASVAEEDGTWKVLLMTGDAGGPYTMRITAEYCKESIELVDILLGEVWLCSGQSNMEMKMSGVRERFPEEIDQATNPSIRQFLVPVAYNFHHMERDYEAGVWVSADPSSVLDFTATGYFFAKQLYEKYQVPIGLITASLGGSPAQAWLSDEALESFPAYREEAHRMKDEKFLNYLLENDRITNETWHRQLDENDVLLQQGSLHCYDPEYDASEWPYIIVPSYWEEEGLGHFHGSVWYRKEIWLSPFELSHPATLLLGNIVDEDTVYVNGMQMGGLPMQYISRKYELPGGVLKAGRNTIVVRVVNCAGMGGFYKGKPYALVLGDQRLDLCGEWQYKIGAKKEPMPEPSFVMWKPTGLYNAMIAPAINYRLRGVLWYQGETNAQNPETYEALLEALICDWRKKWEQGEFPFLYVQLPNFQEPRYSPAAGKWPFIREAQRKTLKLSYTGMAVTIDLGEWNDVHPTNKKDVGYRLALLAEKLAYQEDGITSTGPLLESALRRENKIVLSFTEIGSGLITKDNKRPGTFLIAGEDQCYIAADAEISGNCVIVWQQEIEHPVYVRYAWADQPSEANLYNREGLPASPFQCRV